MSEILQTALWYRLWGWSVLPVRGDKRPAVARWKEYQQRPGGDHHLYRVFTYRSDVAGLALVPGPVSGINPEYRRRGWQCDGHPWGARPHDSLFPH